MNPSKTRLIILFTICTVPFQLSAFAPMNPYSLLSDEDYADQSAQVGPALSSPLNEPIQWESYNSWQCFAKVEAEPICAGDILLMSVMHNGSLIEFHVENELNGDCQKGKSEWEKVMEGSDIICLFAAKLQEDDNLTIWMLDRLKTSNGYWIARNFGREEFSEDPDTITSKPTTVLDYTISIVSDDGELSHLEIKHRDNAVFKTEPDMGVNFYFGTQTDPDKNIVDTSLAQQKDGLSVTGTGRPNLIISKWTGGSHCCFTTYVFELEPTFKTIAIIDGYHTGSYFEDVNHDSFPELITFDNIFTYAFGNFGSSVFPKIIMKYENGSYRMAHDLMKAPPPTEGDLQEHANAFQKGEQRRIPYAAF